MEMHTVWKNFDASVATLTFLVNRYGWIAYKVTDVAAYVGPEPWLSITRCVFTCPKLLHTWVYTEDFPMTQLFRLDVYQLRIWVGVDLRQSMYVWNCTPFCNTAQLQYALDIFVLRIYAIYGRSRSILAVCLVLVIARLTILLVCPAFGLYEVVF